MRSARNALEMRISLIYPPQASAYMPPLGIPTLTAILRDDGYDVMQYDYNVLFLDHMLDKVAKDQRISLDFVQVMRGKKDGFYDLPTLAGSVRMFDELVCQGSTSEDQPSLSRFIKNVVLGDLAKFKPDVVGLSVIYPEQLIPTLIIARKIKLEDPDLKVIVGGDYITSIKKRISINKEMFSDIDYFVLYEGEEALPSLLRCIKNRSDVSNVPNLLVNHDRTVMIDTPYQPLPEGKDYPTPDFSDLPFHMYLSPEPVLPLLGSRGRCYWGKCVFCSHHISHPSPFAARSSANIIKDIKNYNKRYKANHVFFNDNSFHPEQMRILCNDIIKNDLHINFGCDTRFDKRYTFPVLKTMSRAGCRLLIFGLESASQRVLDSMKKGYDLKIVDRILGDCESCGIRTKIMFFLGFPGESRRDVIKTLKFVKDRPIGMLALTNAFILVEDTYIYDHAGKYGIMPITHSPDNDLTQIYDYKCKRCSTPKMRIELLKRYGLLGSLEPEIGTIHYFLYACKQKGFKLSMLA